MRTRAARVVSLALSTLLIASACGGSDARTSATVARSAGADVRVRAARGGGQTDISSIPAPTPPPAAAPAALATDAVSAKEATPDAGGSGEPASAPTFTAQASDSAPAAQAATAMLIRTGTASVEVDSVELAAARLRALATSLGGYVANTSFAGGAGQVRSATLEIKVPAARFDALQGGLPPLGRVDSVNVQAEDVGEEYVDVAAQLANGRRLEARLVALAERQSNRLADLLAVERELARVRGEIDRAEGRLRYLRAHSATSTLTVTVHARAPLVGDSPAANPIAEAFRDAWRVFVGVVAFSIASLGVLVPLGAVAALVFYARRRWPGRRTSRPTPAGQGAVRSSGSSADQGLPPRPPNDARTV